MFKKRMFIVFSFVVDLLHMQHIQKKYFNKMQLSNEIYFFNNTTSKYKLDTRLNRTLLLETGIGEQLSESVANSKHTQLTLKNKRRKRWVMSRFNETYLTAPGVEENINILQPPLQARFEPPEMLETRLNMQPLRETSLNIVPPTIQSMYNPYRDLVNVPQHSIVSPPTSEMLLDVIPLSKAILRPLYSNPTRQPVLNVPKPLPVPILSSTHNSFYRELKENRSKTIPILSLSTTHEAYKYKMQAQERNKQDHLVLVKMIPPELNMTTRDPFMAMEVENELKKTKSGKGTMKKQCGIDNSPDPRVYAGQAKVETYPWLGWLYHPSRDKIVSTVVVLVQKELVIASALDIHRLPKTHFREKSKVVLGHNCSGPRIGVLTYNYHPEYSEGTHSALVLIQLDLRNVTQGLRSICPPPKTFTEATFHAMVLSDDCSKSRIKIYEMDFVSSKQCRQFYRKAGLDKASIWPVHTACGRARSGGRCEWPAGAALVVKQNNRWHLLGFGVQGPGCGAPSRFVDYTQYHRWARVSLARVGRPAVTRLAPNHLVMRRSLTHIQRFGPCDPEEVKLELFTDRTQVGAPPVIKHRYGRIRYNVTMFSNVDYSCMVFRAEYDPRMAITAPPKIMLRRFCRTPAPLCYDAGLLQIDFYVEIFYHREITYKLSVYGQEWKVIDPKSLMKYINHKKSSPAVPWVPPAMSIRDNDAESGDAPGNATGDAT